MTPQKYLYRHDLQGLRAIAIILVILAHSGLSIIEGGFIGVDVFFVLSGYLITGLLFRELDQTGKINFLSFYARRMKRLLPALAVMIIISFGLALLLLSTEEIRAQLASTFFASTWTSNIFFTFTTIDYFNDLATKDLFLHTWSLGVEEQFYLIWPLFLFIIFTFKKNKFLHKIKQSDLMLFALITIMFTSFLFSIYLTNNSPQAAFYLMPSRIWQFSLGAIIYLKRDFLSGSYIFIQHKNFYLNSLLWAGLVLVLGSSTLLHKDMVYPSFWAILPSLGAALIIIAGDSSTSTQTNLLTKPAFVWLGDLSYSLYLWHWPIFTLGFSLGYKGLLIPTLVMTLMTVLFSILTLRLIEYPFWRGRWSRIKNSRIILVSLLIMTSLMFGSFHILRQFPETNQTSNISHKWRADLPKFYRKGCDSWYSHARIEPCIFEEPTAEKTIVLLGDSIGVQWFSIIPELFPKDTWRVFVFTKSACPIVDEDIYYSRIGKIYKVCSDWRKKALDEINTLKPDVIIMGSAATYSFTKKQWINGTSRVLDKLSNGKTKLFIIPGTPSLGFDGPGCIERNLYEDGRINPQECYANNRIQLISESIGFLDEVANNYNDTFILNVNDLVCPNDVCRASNKQGIVVFRDDQHLTNSFVLTQVELIRKRLRSLGNSKSLFQ